MSYSKELCQFVIKNCTALESGGAVEEVQNTVFSAMNTRLSSKIKAIGGWKGKYEFVSVDDDTAFAPAEWPETKGGIYRACYQLGGIDDDKVFYWLSCALGINGTKLCLQFWVS